MEWEELTVEELRSNVTRTANWKSPAPDNVPNFWIKQFTSLHQSIASALSEVLKHPKHTAVWLVECSTILLPRKLGSLRTTDPLHAYQQLQEYNISHKRLAIQSL